MTHYQEKIHNLIKHIKQSQNFILTTHKNCDGDGLGSMLAFYHALIKINKPVRSVTVDKVADKYDMLSFQKYTERFDQLKTPIEKTETAIVFDTNDPLRIEPLHSVLENKCKEIIYIDHHMLLENARPISKHSILESSSASTGEIVYFILKTMGVELNTTIATALYISIVFDTQRFRFIKNSNMSHKVCAEICPYIKNNEQIYDRLFGIHSVEKMNLLSQVINNIEYFHQRQVAVLELSYSALLEKNLDIEDACDFLDMVLEIKTIQTVVLILQLSQNKYKLSFRSKKGNMAKLAELFNGGGHKQASGATLVNYEKNPKPAILSVVPKFIN